MQRRALTGLWQPAPETAAPGGLPHGKQSAPAGAVHYGSANNLAKPVVSDKAPWLHEPLFICSVRNCHVVSSWKYIAGLCPQQIMYHPLQDAANCCQSHSTWWDARGTEACAHGSPAGSGRHWAGAWWAGWASSSCTSCAAERMAVLLALPSLRRNAASCACTRVTARVSL